MAAEDTVGTGNDCEVEGDVTSSEKRVDPAINSTTGDTVEQMTTVETTEPEPVSWIFKEFFKQNVFFIYLLYYIFNILKKV